LDIVGAEVYVTETDSFFRIVLDGALPSELSDPNHVLEWSFYIDTVMAPPSGEAVVRIYNDIDPDYRIRLIMTSYWMGAEIINLKTNWSDSVVYQVDGNTVTFSVPASVLPLTHFNLTVAACLYQQGESVAVDKAPDQGHYNVPKGYVNIKPGLPTLQLSSAHAVVWYNEGNEERARWCAEAFEAAYADIDRILFRPYMPLISTIYVYVSQVDLVAGLQEYNDYSLGDAQSYKNGGAPRPGKNDNKIHIPPDYDLRGIYYQQVLGAMDRICG